LLFFTLFHISSSIWSSDEARADELRSCEERPCAVGSCELFMIIVDELGGAVFFFFPQASMGMQTTINISAKMDRFIPR
jgi:hypothetical protein